MPPTTRPHPAPIIAPARALSIAEPWAYLIASGFKQLENRTWRTDYRGPLAIHSSKTTRNMYDQELIYELTALHPAIYRAVDDERIDEDHQLFHLGAIVGTVDVVDCIAYDPTRDDPDDLFDRFNHLAADGPAPELPVGAWAQGPYCFVLANPRRFAQPVRCPGKLSLWSLSAELQRAVVAAGREILTDPGQPSRPPEPLGEVAGENPTAKADAKTEKRHERQRDQRRRKILGQ